MKSIESQVKSLGYREEPYIGMPIPHLGRYREPGSVCDSVNMCPLAMTYTPWQRWCETYEPAVAHHRGTIFPELDLPFLGGGGDC